MEALELSFFADGRGNKQRSCLWACVVETGEKVNITLSQWGPGGIMYSFQLQADRGWACGGPKGMPGIGG